MEVEDVVEEEKEDKEDVGPTTTKTNTHINSTHMVQDEVNKRIFMTPSRKRSLHMCRKHMNTVEILPNVYNMK